MQTLSATDARKNWFEILRTLKKDHRHYRITSKEGGVILLSEEDYDGLLETLELLSVPGMRKSIQQARKEIKEGKTYTMNEVFGD